MPSRFALVVFVFAMAASAVFAPAVARPLAGATTKAEAPPQASAETQSAEEIRKALAVARSQLERIEAAGETPADAPPGTPPTDILSRLTQARMLASAYEKQLKALEKTNSARQRQAEAQRANEAWRGFEQAPPYSVLLVDELRDELEAANNAITSARATSALFQRLDGEYTSKLKASQGAARLAAEAADRARGTPAFAAREWEHELAVLRASVDSATQTLLQLSLRGAQAEAAAATSSAELYTRKLNAVGTAVELPRAELQRVLTEIDARRRKAEADLDRANRAAAAAAEAVAGAELRLAAARAIARCGGSGRQGGHRRTGTRGGVGARSRCHRLPASLPAARIPASTGQ